MAHYLDTCVVIPILLPDAHTAKVAAWFERIASTVLVSTFLKVEFSAAVSRQVRIRQQSPAEAASVLRNFDRWLSVGAHLIGCSNDDILAADLIVRDFDTKLSVTDAIHLVLARRFGATLATFVERLADAARRQAVPVVVPN